MTKELSEILMEHHRTSGSLRPIEISCTDHKGMVQISISSVLHAGSTLYIASP